MKNTKPLSAFYQYIPTKDPHKPIFDLKNTQREIILAISSEVRSMREYFNRYNSNPFTKHELNIEFKHNKLNYTLSQDVNMAFNRFTITCKEMPEKQWGIYSCDYPFELYTFMRIYKLVLKEADRLKSTIRNNNEAYLKLAVNKIGKNNIEKIFPSDKNLLLPEVRKGLKDKAANLSDEQKSKVAIQLLDLVLNSEDDAYKSLQVHLFNILANPQQ
jgi:hypothetical protein